MTTTTQPPPRSLPAPVFAALHPQAYLQAVLESTPSTPRRANNRQPQQFRPSTSNTNSLVHCNGSAVIRQGGTSAVCGVRAELLPARDVANLPASEVVVRGRDQRREYNEENDELEEQNVISGLNLLVPNIEMNTGCNSTYIPGNAPSSIAQTLSHRLLSLLHITRLVRLSDLRITESKASSAQDVDNLMDSQGADDDEDNLENRGPAVHAYWTLYIDILFISLDGNPFDVAWQSLLAALRTTILPRAWYDLDAEAILCSPDPAQATKLNLRGAPVASTFAVFEPAKMKGARPVEDGGKTPAKGYVLADPDAFEEGLCSEVVTVVVDRGEGGVRIRRVEKGGGVVVDNSLMRECVNLAGRRQAEVLGQLEDDDDDDE